MGENHLRGSYWGQRAIADHKDDWSSSPKTLPKESWGGGT